MNDDDNNGLINQILNWSPINKLILVIDIVMNISIYYYTYLFFIDDSFYSSSFEIAFNDFGPIFYIFSFIFPIVFLINKDRSVKKVGVIMLIMALLGGIIIPLLLTMMQ